MRILCSLIILAVFVFSIPASAAKPQLPLDGLAYLKDYSVGRSSSYDRAGRNNDRVTMQAGDTITLFKTEKAGMIHHIWFTIGGREGRYGSRLVLRMYWDGNDYPSVECPLGDFFGAGFGYDQPTNNALFEVSADGRARNCFIPMPYADGAKLTLTNESGNTIKYTYFYVDYREMKRLPRGMGRFHAQYRQAFPTTGDNYVILDTKGKGHFLGCHVSCRNNRNGWMGEGDDMIYIDGSEKPTLAGTGSEDYFSDAWGYRHFCHPYHGLSFYQGCLFKHAICTAYRYHVQDPITFDKSIKMTMEHGTGNNRADDWSSVAFWYQKKAVSVAGTMPSVGERLIEYPKSITVTGAETIQGKNLLDYVITGGGSVKVQEMDGGKSQLLFKNRYPEGYISMRLVCKTRERIRIKVKFNTAVDCGKWKVFVNSMAESQELDMYSENDKVREWTSDRWIQFDPDETILEFRCQDKNGWATGKQLGIDQIEFIKYVRK
jgi:D-arabinan exo alpha-(1,3)/(1,5)-arabinofuranosidase (non-reducing end)